MAISKKKFRRGSDFNNLEITNAKSVQVNQDASSSNELVRKSQAESIAQAKAEGNLIDVASNASTTTAFTSQSMVNLLATKQDNMSIHSSSNAFLEIVDGVEIKVKQLLSQSVTVDTTEVSLSAWLTSNPSHSLEEGDMLILQGATVNQQRSWIHNGGNAGTIADFTTLVTDYNESVIRGMFSAGHSYLNYDAATGKYSLVFGNANGQIGAQTIPVNNAEFQTITASTVLAALKGLESYIATVDSNATGGAATIGTRLDSISGVSGNNLGAFSDSAFPSNSTIKQVFEASLIKHLAADADRASIRSSFASADASIQTSLDNEIARATAAETAEVTARTSADATLQSAMSANTSFMISESQARFMGDSLLQQRLGVVEGDDQTVGSIAKAEADAKAYADSKVADEAVLRQAADAALDLKIDQLAEGDITFVGVIESNTTVTVRSERIAAGDTRNGQMITNIDLKAGETFVIGDDLDIGLSDATNGIASYEKGDKLMITQDVSSGSLLEANINAVPANQTGLAVQNVTGSPTIQLDGNSKLDVKDDSISLDHLADSIVADIDDKRSLTQNNTITSDSDTHIVTDITTGATQNVYFKRVSNTSDALTGTKRAILSELHVSSNGSGNPLAPNFAHTFTSATHYQGTCNDLSISIAGGNNEGVVSNSIANVYASGSYNQATSNHLGVNSGVTGIAQNAGTSNIGITGFGKAGGAGKDRGGVFAISDLTFEAWSGHRAVNPISYPDAAVIADAGTSANGKAVVAVGDSIFEGGTVTVPSAVNDTDAVNFGDVKSKEYSETFSLPANGSVTINHSLGSKKVILSVWYQDELITSALDIDERTSNSFKIHNDSSEAMSSVDVNVIALS